MSVRRHTGTTGTKMAARRCVPLAMVVLLATFLFLAYLPAAPASPGWSTPAQLSTQSDYDQYEPKTAVDASGASHVVWYGYDSTGTNEHIYYTTNASGTWSAPVLLSTQSDYDQYNPQIALDAGGKAHVVWYGYDSTDTDVHIYYTTNASGTWSAPVLLSTQSDYNQQYPQIALDASGKAHVVWYGYDSGENYEHIYYTTNASGTWSAPVLLSTQSDYSQYDPQIALDAGGKAHVVWYGEDSGDYAYQIYYTTNASGTWSAPDHLSTQSEYDQYDPQIALNASGKAHVVWYGYDSSDNDYQINYVTNTGGTWTAPMCISPDDSDPCYPVIAVDSGGNAHAIWHGHPVLSGGSCSRLYATNIGAAPGPTRCSSPIATVRTARILCN